MIGAQNLASGFRGDDKQGDWNNVNILGLPDLPFDVDAGFEFFDPVAVADEDAVTGPLFESRMNGKACVFFRDFMIWIPRRSARGI